MHTDDLPDRIRIPALTAPELDELEAFHIDALAAALRRDALSVGGGRTRNADAMRGSQHLAIRGTISADANWRLILAEETSEGPAAADIARELKPLTDHRAALDPLFVPKRSGGGTHETVKRFYDRYTREISETTYFLIAGRGSDIPFALQQQLSAGKLVGRLAFAGADAYAAYARKVVNAERNAPSALSRPLLAFGPDCDPSTLFSHRVLVEPMVRVFEAGRSGRKPVALLAGDATRQNVLDQLCRADEQAPALWFSASHGMEYRDPMHPDQGALVDQRLAQIRAGDIAEAGPGMLENGIAVLFACNGGGTPCERWWPSTFVQRPAHAPPNDHVAQLPLALLAHPRGALAVVAHLDILSDWGLRSYAGRRPGDLEHPGVQPLRRLLLDLARGVPVGFAMRMLHRTAAELNQLFTRTLFWQSRKKELGPQDDFDLSAAWMRWYDTQGWTVFGDPRVCLEGVDARLTLEDVTRSGRGRRPGP